MGRIFYISLFLLLSSAAWAQSFYQRKAGESINAFLTRVKPATAQKSISLDRVIVAPYSNNKDTVYITSYREELITFNDSTTHRYILYLLYPTDSSKFKMNLIAIINNWEKTFVSPILDSVFFANADKDSEKEIVIFYYYKLPEGTHYDTQVFDAPDINKLKNNNLKELTEMRQKLFGGCDCTYNGTTAKARLASVKEIKKELIRLGFK